MLCSSSSVVLVRPKHDGNNEVVLYCAVGIACLSDTATLDVAERHWWLRSLVAFLCLRWFVASQRSRLRAPRAVGHLIEQLVPGDAVRHAFLRRLGRLVRLYRVRWLTTERIGDLIIVAPAEWGAGV